MPFLELLLQHASKYAMLFGIAFAVTYALTPIIRNWATRIGMVDRPGVRRMHLLPPPRGGGIAVVLGVQVACLFGLLSPLSRGSIGVSPL